MTSGAHRYHRRGGYYAVVLANETDPYCVDRETPVLGVGRSEREALRDARYRYFPDRDQRRRASMHVFACSPALYEIAHKGRYVLTWQLIRLGFNSRRLVLDREVEECAESDDPVDRTMYAGRLPRRIRPPLEGAERRKS